MCKRYKMRVVVKVGSSTLVYENGKMNIHRVNELCEVLADLKNAGHEIILVSSGAIALGVGKLALTQKPKDIPTKQAAASVGQCELMYNYDRIFSKYNHTVSQILLTGADFESMDRHQNFNILSVIYSILSLILASERSTVWPARRDLNPRSSESESAALSNCATGGYINIKDSP